jgi:mRNA-degrading endonuclease RelE of RelBE toxin-antitoxin system
LIRFVHDRRQILDAIERHLRYTPTQIGRSRIKRLRSMNSPTYRLRIGDYRVFYDVDEMLGIVTILRILSKAQALQYLIEVSDERNRTE